MVLKKADTFQGKRKVKDCWSEVEYEVIYQVTNGVPSYEIKDLSGTVKVTHCSWLFLLATQQGEATSLCENKDTHISVSAQSALAELTPLECENDLPGDNMEGWLMYPHQSCSTRMGGWHTVTTSHGGPQNSTPGSLVWNEG